MDPKIALGLIHAIKDITFASIGAVVFVHGFTDLTPLTQMGVEALGIWGAYFGANIGTTKWADGILAKQSTKTG